MTTRRDRTIQNILGEEGEAGDHSLRRKALDRAIAQQAPRTLTAWEWEAWYAENGVPDAHSAPAETHSAPAEKSTAVSWWQRWFKREK